MEFKDLKIDKRYIATYQYVHFADKPVDKNGKRKKPEEREVFTVEKTYSGYPNDIALSVKYYMGHYGAIQGKLIGEINEDTNEEDRVWS
jgi:hypothetical protein